MTDKNKIYRMFHSERMNQAIGLDLTIVPLHGSLVLDTKFKDDHDEAGGGGHYYVMEDGSKVHKFLDV